MPIFDRKLLIQLAVVIGVVIVILGVRFIFGGNEDTWLCEGGQWVRHGVPASPPPETGCGSAATSSANGASVSSTTVPTPQQSSPDVLYCSQHGGKIEYRTSGSGAGYAVCVFFGGNECETNSYLSNECPVKGTSILGYKTAAARYCADFGGTYTATRNSYYKTPKEQGTCRFLNGRSCAAADFWNGKCAKEVSPAPDPTKAITFPITDALRATPLQGTILPMDPLVATYGAMPADVFRKHASLVTSLKRILPSFDPLTMQQGYQTVVADLQDKRKLVVFSGCSFDGCFGTMRVAAYDPKKSKIYLLAEDENVSTVNFYGAPDAMVQSALLNVYFSLR